METDTHNNKKKRPIRKAILILLAGIFICLLAVGVYVTRNFNQLLTDALLKSFNSTLISEVYELKFQKLRVNLLDGNIKVFDVVLKPRLKPKHNYPYINSSLKLSAHKILLTDVRILDLVRKGILQLEKIEISKPNVELTIGDEIPIFFPFKDNNDTTMLVDISKKHAVGAFILQEFDLNDASLQMVNTAKKREINIKQFSLTVNDMVYQQLPGRDLVSYSHVELSIGGLTGRMKHETLKYLSFKDYHLSIDTFKIDKSVDTLIYHFADFKTGIKLVDIQTADSIFHISLQSFQLSYKDKSVQMSGFKYSPNMSNALLQAKSRYQKTNFSGNIGSLSINGLNFDSLIYSHKLIIEEIKLDKIGLSLYKDKSKPLNKKKFPKYLSQLVSSIPIPILVKSLYANNINLTYIERKADGGNAKVTVGRGRLTAKNITNQSPSGKLTLNASAYLENKVYLSLSLAYSYAKPQFNYLLRAGKFSLTDLNQLIVSYSPGKINKGTVDEILLSGTAYRTYSKGMLKFLYHDLEVDMKLREKKWQNDVLAFAANTVIPSNNPMSVNLPPRKVTFNTERDMNKGGFNIILKSMFAGMKETIIMSKENKKAYKKEKRKIPLFN